MKFAENVMTLEGNAVFEETVKMSVHNESISNIIRSLTDIYSNPMLALSREYLSNAYDATIARMGIKSSFGTILDTPIELTLPSVLNPNFVVRDYGTGMDRNILATVFPQYGASTKRDNNNEIGGFGLGAKSALAVVSNFTVISVKDGKKNTAIIQKGADGVGEVSFLPEIETKEPSGTTVTIALPNPHALNNIFRDSNLLLGFPHGSILLNGKMHENSVFNSDLYTKIDEDGWVLNSLMDWENSNNGNRKVGSQWERVVVVGPISYRVSNQDLPDNPEVFGADSAFSVLNLPIGSVDFTPARENLIFSDRTINAIVDATKRLSKGVHDCVQMSITAAPTMIEAVRRADVLRMNGFELDFTYKGDEIPERKPSSLLVEDKKTWISDHNSKMTPQELSYHYGNLSRTIVVTGVKDAAAAKVLNRFRKPFADRHAPTKLSSDNLIIFYMEAENSELSKWAPALALEIYTVEEWEAKGVAYRKEINEERKAKRLAEGGDKGEVNYGSLPIGFIERKGYSSYDIPKVHGGRAADVTSDGHVIYVRIDANATETFSHKFAQGLSNGKGDATLSAQTMNRILSAVTSQYSKDAKRVSFVRIPANTKVETFLKAVPHAITLDVALDTIAKEINADSENILAITIAKDSRDWNWLDRLNDTYLKDIHNETVREFLSKARKELVRVEDSKERNILVSAGNFAFDPAFNSLFAEFKKETEAANKFPLPLMGDMGRNSFRMDNAIQYINLMYPATTTV